MVAVSDTSVPGLLQTGLIGTTLADSNSVTREVMDRALFHSINAYCIENLQVDGFCCRTNLPVRLSNCVSMKQHDW